MMLNSSLPNALAVYVQVQVLGVHLPPRAVHDA